MDKVMFSKEKLLKCIEIEAHIIFKKLSNYEVATCNNVLI